MKVLRSIPKIRNQITLIKKQRKTIGFVPTMGYLHAGHLSLVRAAKKENDVTVMSIYVNPTQFGPQEDFAKYPRDISRDLKLAQKAGVDIIFLPRNKDMYPRGYLTYVKVQKITDTLCGGKRPEHFCGVCTIVAKLLNITSPDKAYFGQKDAQQALVIKKMAEDLNIPVQIKVMPIIREIDGLAMSSRNVYLSPEEREDAVVINKALFLARQQFLRGEKNSNKILSSIKRLISSKHSAKIDYVKIVDTENLLPIKIIKGEALIAIACYIGKTRLIDNIILRG